MHTPFWHTSLSVFTLDLLFHCFSCVLLSRPTAYYLSILPENLILSNSPQ